MNESEMKKRTREFAVRILTMVAALPHSIIGKVLGGQAARSGTSVGANYRAACRARSIAEFISKLGVAEEEADETAYWLELIAEAKLLPSARLSRLLQEANELTAILSASRMTARRNNRKSKIENRKSA